MSRTPLDDQTLEGYQSPSAVQFSVFLDNRVGKLLELTDVFENQQLRIVGFSVSDASDFAVVRLVSSNANRARDLLMKSRLPFGETEILIVELTGNRTLRQLCRVLLAAELSIEYAYPLMVQPRGAATVALCVDDQVLAEQLLQRKQFVLLGESDLSDGPGEEDDPEAV